MSTPTQTQTNTQQPSELKTGSIVVDSELPAHKQSRAVVVNTPPLTIADWEIREGYTVADDNPSYDASEPVCIVVYKQVLDLWYPYYSGIQPLELTELNEHNITFYAFPHSRLKYISRPYQFEVKISRLEPSPYCTQIFTREDEAGLLRDIAEAGEVFGRVVARPLSNHRLQILDGHRRVCAGAVNGISTVEVVGRHVSEFGAAKIFAKNHLVESDCESERGYTNRERRLAIYSLYQDFGSRIADLPGISESDIDEYVIDT